MPRKNGCGRRPQRAAMKPVARAVTATAPYPAASFSPIARPRRAGPTRSIFMFTVVDQVRPWFTPRSTLAKMTQPQLGARISSSGTGKPKIHPTIRTGLRPKRSLSAPARKLATGFVRPKATMKVSAAVTAASPKPRWASSGRTVRSCPIMPPTSALTPTRSENWARLARRPSLKEPGAGDIHPMIVKQALECSGDRERSEGPPLRSVQSGRQGGLQSQADRAARAARASRAERRRARGGERYGLPQHLSPAPGPEPGATGGKPPAGQANPVQAGRRERQPVHQRPARDRELTVGGGGAGGARLLPGPRRNGTHQLG